MIYQNIEFFNVEELEVIPNLGGVRLQRFPKEVRNQLGHLEHERGRFMAQRSIGCEIRFVTDAKYIRITLSSVESSGKVLVYKGNFLHSAHQLSAGVMTTLELEEPTWFSQVEADKLTGFYASNVWRFVFSRESLITFYHLDTFGHEYRPPHKDELPSLTWLAYGSSITCGSNANVYSNSYVYQAAHRLGIQIMNKGLSGSAFSEPVIADYLANNNEWDLITLEIGVNGRERIMPDDFEKRVRYLLNSIISKHPNKPIVIMGIYPSRSTYLINQERLGYVNTIKYLKVLDEIVKELNHEHLYLLDANELLPNYHDLCVDLLHPSDHGHIMIGENLASKLYKILNKCNEG